MFFIVITASYCAQHALKQGHRPAVEHDIVVSSLGVCSRIFNSALRDYFNQYDAHFNPRGSDIIDRASDLFSIAVDSQLLQNCPRWWNYLLVIFLQLRVPYNWHLVWLIQVPPSSLPVFCFTLSAMGTSMGFSLLVGVDSRCFWIVYYCWNVTQSQPWLSQGTLDVLVTLFGKEHVPQEVFLFLFCIILHYLVNWWPF